MNLRTTRAWITSVLVAVALAAVTSCGSDESNGVTSPGRTRELDSGNLAPGNRYEHAFAAEGTYAYHCELHPMNGTVRVSATAGDTIATVTIVTSSGPFPGALVKPGGRVVWVNNTGAVHTVTSD